ncbi:MAG: glycine cleavage system protein GcvH [Clostridiales Family XIII bacterium]|jgi:glycine cleavage system H protein|nr:glycine cleavage system protein GcvH [Clostridiales Family XIII bacterium]
MKVIQGLYYTKEHEWLKVDGNKGTVGITDFAVNALGDIAYLELPEAGDRFAAEEVFGVVESVKAASDLNIPVTGVVTAVNTAVVDDPALVNADAYESWLIEIEIEDAAELSGLMDAAAYEATEEA